MANIAPTFQEFWDAYAMKLDRKGAEPVWNRLSARDKRAAIRGIAAYREDCRRRGIAMAYPAKYLRHRRWEDESGTPAPSASRKPMVMEKW